MTALTRITLGLVSSMLGILMVAKFSGLLPDQERCVVDGRGRVAESLAFTATAMIPCGNQAELDVLLSAISSRYPDLVSIGIRTTDGSLLMATPGHKSSWQLPPGTASTSQFLWVPLSHPDKPDFGQIELCFTPVRGEGVFSGVGSPFMCLLFVTAAVAFIAFRTFLKLVLKQLDPSRAVPRRVREALDVLADGLMIIGLDERILLANTALSEVIACEPDKMRGRKADSLGFRVNGIPMSRPWKICQELERVIAGVPMQIDTANGRMSFNVNCSPLVGSEGQHRGTLVTFDDVTQLEEKKQQLSLARDDAESANRAKSDFLANMSHEIRNPMNAIVGFTDILRRGMAVDIETRQEYLNTIHTSGEHLVGLINDILDLSKIEAGKLELEIQQCRPHQLLAEIVNVLGMKARQRNLVLDQEIVGTIPETIESDPTRLRQVLMNLVGNAIKFTQSGSVRVVIDVPETTDRPLLRFKVMDTGVGMTREQCGRIFEEFVQADSSVTRRFGGTGLGLTISRRLSQALGGDIEADSVLGQGSTFTLTIDPGDVSDVPRIDRSQATESLRVLRQSREEGISVHFKPARVLVTDDMSVNRQLVSVVLQHAGLTVDQAEDGLDAVNHVAEHDYDLLLMDIQMPVMDGLTATRRLREQGLTAPIVALTANVMQHHREQCAAAGCTTFMTKPIDIDKLLDTVAEFLPTQSETAEQALPMHPARRNSVNSHVSPADNGAHMAAVAESTTPVARLDSVIQLVNEASSDAQCHAIVTPATPGRQSTLPIELEGFREIVCKFVDRLPKMMTELRAAWDSRRFEELHALAHKLKGTGGTVGFADFAEPAGRLQQHAEACIEEGTEELLLTLEALAASVEAPPPVTTTR